MDDTFRTRSQPSKARPIVITALASFLFGGALVGYFVWQNGPGALQEPAVQEQGLQPEEVAGLRPPSPTPSATASEAADAVEQITQQQGGIDQRLAAAEQRLARLDLQAQAAAGNAARAEGLLIAFATRRAIEKKAELGYLADQLRLRFGDALPNAVNTVVTFSRDPVTLSDLTAQLEGLAPELEENAQGSGFSRFSEQLGRLFTIRRETTPSPQPEMRLERARTFLQSGRVEAAIAEVRNLPGAQNAQGWLTDAERYASARRALDLIETSAVLEPQRLRDGAGNRISQPSPAEAE
ncbi:hypothetical protein E3U23_00100 [Erythrobacter litoralis]|uniref:hypothetical protein n=1 Tax=Erythrobacter litoralis TaxID=39960 RepID=UPI002435DA2B|nr:hypothetical protein [Erythrobacter litoralis]MDG6077598.1 hypothetical protein [Erythrobacter litoralis]